MTVADKIRDSIHARFGGVSGVFEECLGSAGCAGLAQLLDRRSCRDYAAHEVPEGLVRVLLAAGLSAPSKSDLQQADVVWVRDARLRDEVLEGIGGAGWIKRAPVFLVVCANGARLASLFEGEDFANDHFDALFNATVDAAIVLEGIVAAAAWWGWGPARSARSATGRSGSVGC